MYHYADVPQWSQLKLSENEVPLTTLSDVLQSGSSRFELRQSKQVSSAWTLWDALTENVVVVTHAFVIKWTSPLDSGNFVPDGQPTPENLTEAGRRSEPGPNAQLSLAFDCKMDDSVSKSLGVIDKWVGDDLKFNPSGVPRSQWMTPSWIASNGKFIVNSQLFSVKSPFNTVAGKYQASYPVHPWIAAVCDAKMSNWVPNPNRVQFYDGQAGILERLDKCSEPNLLRGDLVKMSFRFVFTSGRTYWHCAVKPMQVVRVGHVASAYGSIQDDEPVGLVMPKLGDKISLFKKLGEPSTKEYSLDWNLEPDEDGLSENEGGSGASSTASEACMDKEDSRDEPSHEGTFPEVPDEEPDPDQRSTRGGRSGASKRKRMEDEGDSKKKSQKRKPS